MLYYISLPDSALIYNYILHILKRAFNLKLLGVTLNVRTKAKDLAAVMIKKKREREKIFLGHMSLMYLITCVYIFFYLGDFSSLFS